MGDETAYEGGSFRWYATQLLPGLEATAAFYLGRAGIRHFIPKVPGEVRKGVRQEIRLFPGYAFVELERPDEAGAVNRVRGVHKVLPIHSVSPTPLPRRFVDDLRGRIEGGEYDDLSPEALLRRFVPKDEVTIISGPFEGFRGMFDGYRKGAGIVLTYLLRQETRVEVPLHQLAPVSKRSGPESRSVRALGAV